VGGFSTGAGLSTAGLKVRGGGGAGLDAGRSLEGEGVRGGPLHSSNSSSSSGKVGFVIPVGRIGFSSSTALSAMGFFLGSLGIFGLGLTLPLTGDLEGSDEALEGTGSSRPIPLSGLVLQLRVLPLGEAPSVLRRLLSTSDEAKFINLSKVVSRFSCRSKTLHKLLDSLMIFNINGEFSL
jgi:hypothetical protein